MMSLAPSNGNDAIPEPHNHITAAIDEALAKLGRASDWGGVFMSSVTTECDRSIWYSLHWVHDPEQPTGKKERIFETGHLYEERLIRYLRAANVLVDDLDPATGRQWQVSLANGWLRGKADGRATNVPTAEKEEHVIECKSLKAADYRAIIKHKLEKAKPEHYAQCQMYMHGLGIQRALYIGANKDTDEIVTERLHYDPAFCLGLEARIARIVAAPEPPPRVSNDPTALACKFCKAKTQCHERAWPRLNCRTCAFVTLSDDYMVHCDKHAKALLWKDQQAGCPDHRFIPALVPGEQVDVIDGDLIVYTMPDGSEWIDGRRE